MMNENDYLELHYKKSKLMDGTTSYKSTSLMPASHPSITVTGHKQSQWSYSMRLQSEKEVQLLRQHTMVAMKPSRMQS